jgi:hypothetical protein
VVLQDVLKQRTLSYDKEKDQLNALKKTLEKRKKPMQNKQNRKATLKEDVRPAAVCFSIFACATNISRVYGKELQQHSKRRRNT